jgi:F-type H+-transporting ATPase subunit b
LPSTFRPERARDADTVHPEATATMNALLLLANERPLINIDATLFLNMALWVFLFIVLRGLLWNPMLKLIQARETGMEGARVEARKLEKEGAELRTEYEAAQRSARASASEERDKIRADAKRKEAELLAEARNASQTAVDAQRAEIQKQRATLEQEIKSTVPVLASDIASKVLGREVRA